MKTSVRNEFETEEEAMIFCKKQNECKNPIDDIYISEPMYVDEAKIYKDMSWVNKTRKYWAVSVETYS
jgi:hypothetical protein